MRVDSAEPPRPTWITVQPVAGRKPKPSTSVRALPVGSEPGGDAEAEARGDEQRRRAAGSPAHAERSPGSPAS